MSKKRSAEEELLRLKRKIQKLEEREEREKSVHQPSVIISGEYGQGPSPTRRRDSDSLFQPDTSVVNVESPSPPRKYVEEIMAAHRGSKVLTPPNLNVRSETSSGLSTSTPVRTNTNVETFIASSSKGAPERSRPSLDVSKASNARETVKPRNPADSRASFETDDLDNNNSIPDRKEALLNALGDELSLGGQNIHNSLPSKWTAILRKGLDLTTRDQLFREYSAPDNCKLLKAPTLNDEILAVVEYRAKNRDKLMENKQNQLGLGITAISRGITELIEHGENYEVNAMKHFNRGCRLLLDLHHTETISRRHLFKSELARTEVFKNLRIQENDRDDTLFGNKLGKLIKKQGLVPSAPVHARPSSSTHGDGIRDAEYRFRRREELERRPHM